MEPTCGQKALFELLRLLAEEDRLPLAAYKQEDPWWCCESEWCDAQQLGSVFQSKRNGRWLMSVQDPDPKLPFPGYSSEIPKELLDLVHEEEDEPFVTGAALRYLGITVEEALDLAGENDVFLGVVPD